MRDYLRFVLRVTLRLTLVSTLVGVLLGVICMFNREPIIADSGAKPAELSYYAFWIPVSGLLFAGLGLAVGVVVGSVVFLVRRRRTTSSSIGRVHD